MTWLSPRSRRNDCVSTQRSAAIRQKLRPDPPLSCVRGGGGGRKSCGQTDLRPSGHLVKAKKKTPKQNKNPPPLNVNSSSSANGFGAESSSNQEDFDLILKRRRRELAGIYGASESLCSRFVCGLAKAKTTCCAFPLQKIYSSITPRPLPLLKPHPLHLCQAPPPTPSFPLAVRQER